jgi:hypothetical protein
MLMNLLNSHPLILCHGDLMTADVERFGEDWAFETGFTPHSSFRDEVRVSEEKRPEVVGFPIKIKANLHQSLRKRQGLKIVFLERKNRLAVLLSRELGNVLRLYPDNGEVMAEFSERHSSHPPIHIDPNHALAFFEEGDAAIKDAMRSLDGTDWVRVTYEDICAETTATMRAIHAHLGVPFQPPCGIEGWGSTKLNKRTLSQSIANFAELERDFGATRWASYFTEGI